ncbi:granulins-like [Elysia marginata]|uniref:Granulins-like n=1 Tax=Elysia marginata TaxID=1093978 RepID=A0AAV4IAX1_9GAST|nr:granulins-like [Elysia marginata]
MLHKRCYRKSNTYGFPEETSDMALVSHEGLIQQPSKKLRVIKDSLTCPDGSKCPNGQTCCKDSTDAYACCPMPEATCCEDRVHCCPKGYTCDTSKGSCKQGNSSIALAVKEPTFSQVREFSVPEPDVSENNSIPCPGGAVSCPNQYTCCEIQSGGYGCCPMSQAVCCADRIHCCPHNYRCDVQAGTCTKGDKVLAWFSKQPAISKQVAAPLPENKVTCPDRSTCPSGQTCCENRLGHYACCPLPRAVCCSDKMHCCPEDYTCDVGSGTCSQGTDILTWFTKAPSTPAPVVREVTCPDHSTCPSGQTCCADQEGGYSCCPLPQAVCCSDKLHCCPEGYTCDVSAGRCNKGEHVLTFFKKQPSKPVTAAVGDIMCPDQSTCPSESTCCEDEEGHYECCPLPEAVCCSDKLHCCPTGFICDVSAGKCNMSSVVISWFTKQPSKSAPVLRDTTCPDQSTCPSGQTCCEDQQGGYACCPLPQAVCCSDKLHCCPEGYTCDVSAGRLHCCPSGYTCDVSAGRCNKGNEFVALFTKQPAIPALAVNDVVCPDQSSCPSGSTCCETEEGGYGCCPLLNAVCCSDKVHCCPEGYTCDVSQGTCNKGKDTLAFVKKQPATPAPAVSDVTCPDQSVCPSGSTCCLNQQGGYGCCPVPHVR